MLNVLYSFDKNIIFDFALHFTNMCQQTVIL